MRDAFSRRADTTPDSEALIDPATDRTWSYADLDADVRDTAGVLASQGIAPGDRVAVLMEPRPAFVRLVHATARLGAVLVPLNVQLTVPELREHASLVDPDLFVCESGTESVAEALVDGPTLSVDRSRSPDGPRVEPHRWEEDEHRVVLFTSGTTGEPKGVPLTAGNLRASATASALRLGVLPDDRWLDPLPPYHMGGLAPIVRSAVYGTAVVLQREFDPDRTVTLATEYGVTGMSVVPTMLRRLLDADESLPETLRFVLTGGAPTPPALVARCAASGIPVCPTYGMTETASQVATATPGAAHERPESSGRPLSTTQVTVVNDDGERVPAGETGELVVDGPTVTPGYLDRNKQEGGEDESFGPHGFHTGDVGYRDESGYVYVLNRRSDRIITGGKNVHPGEVIAALRGLPGIADAFVLGLSDPEWGERVGALIVPAGDDEGFDPSDKPISIREGLGDRLAPYKHPRTVAVVDALPRTVSGTVDRDRARKRLLADGVEIG